MNTDEQGSHVTRIREIAEEIDVRFGVTSAERGRLIAERLYAEGNESHILATMADGCAKYMRDQNVAERKSIQAGSAARGVALLNGSASVRQTSFLDYPITIPGEQTMPLRDACRLDIEQARQAIAAQMAGMNKTLRQLDHIASCLASFAEDESVGSLVARGALHLDELQIAERVA